MKKKILFINTVCGFGSTGRIVCDLAASDEYESLVCYGRKSYEGDINSYKFANFFDNAFGAIRTILFDNNLNICSLATKRLIRKIKEFNPDIIHIHNLHGYYLNIEMIFKFLKEYNKPVIWTLHDCWALTGYCPSFDFAKCQKYKSECKECKHKFSYPFSIFKQNVTKEYYKKKELFNSINNLILVVPSDWLKKRVQESYLKNNRIIVINNGIDLTKSKSSEKYRKFTVLAVANYWTEEKGLEELKKVIPLLDKEIDTVIVGKLKDKSPIFNRCRLIGQTSNYGELIELYGKSHVFINPSLEDVFGMVNVEAQSCGTPVVAYNTGGIPETICEGYSYVVDKYDYKELISYIDIIRSDNKQPKSFLPNVEKFNVLLMKNKYRDIYRNID